MTDPTRPQESRSASSTEKPWTVQDILIWSTNYLKEKGSDTARLDTELLLAHALGVNRVGVYMAFDKPLTPEERGKVRGFLKRRAAGEPVAYITGSREFMGLSFRVAPGVLIPRPDTEVLVEAVEASLAESSDSAAGTQVLDLGCGSGCISLSLAHRTGVSVTGWDSAEAAISMARENAGELGVEGARFERRDATAPDSWKDAVGAFDIIVANPPYVCDPEAQELPATVADYEPREALVAGVEGLDFYRAVCGRLPEALRSGGRVFFEIGWKQAAAVTGLFHEAGLGEVRVIQDYGGRDRVVAAHRREVPA